METENQEKKQARSNIVMFSDGACGAISLNFVRQAGKLDRLHIWIYSLSRRNDKLIMTRPSK